MDRFDAPRPITQQELAELAGDVSPLCLHSEGNDRQRLTVDDAILRRVNRCWPTLSEETRSLIDSIVVNSLLAEG